MQHHPHYAPPAPNASSSKSPNAVDLAFRSSSANNKERANFLPELSSPPQSSQYPQFLDEPQQQANPPPPPPPPLKHAHHFHSVRQDSVQSYVATSNDSSGGYLADSYQAAPLSLTQQELLQPHHHPPPPLHHQSIPPPSGPDNQYQEYYPPPSTSGTRYGNAYIDDYQQQQQQPEQQQPQEDYSDEAASTSQGAGFYYPATPQANQTGGGYVRHDDLGAFSAGIQNSVSASSSSCLLSTSSMVMQPSQPHQPQSTSQVVVDPFPPSEAVLIHVKSVMKSIHERMRFTDVTIVARKERIRAHRGIISSHSTFLKTLLTDFEQRDGSEEAVLVIEDVAADNIRLMMQFFYTGEVNLHSQDDIQPLKEVCQMLGVPSLLARLEELSFSLQCLPPSSNYDHNYDHDTDHHQDDVDMPLPPPPPPPPLFKPTSNKIRQQQGKIEEIEGQKSSSTPNSAKKFGCSKCPSKFLSEESLTAHERIHLNLKPFVCSICDVNVSSKSHLQIHMRKHTGEKPYSCKICEKAFADQSAFRRHVQTHENAAASSTDGKNVAKKSSQECSICKKEYADKSTLRRHWKEKHEEQEARRSVFICQFCKKEFSRKESIVAHLVKVHQNENNDDPSLIKPTSSAAASSSWSGSQTWSSVKCPQCDKVFAKQSAMEVHLRSHTGEKPYVCEVCGKKFGRSNNLKLHRRIHSGEKPYVCHQADCGKAFSDISAWKRHTRTHTGEKPFACSKNCGKSFGQPGTAKNHAKNCKGPRKCPAGDKEEASEINARNCPEGGNLWPSDDANINLNNSSSSIMQRKTNNSGRHNNSSLYGGSMLPVAVLDPDNSLSVMAGSEPPVFNTDTLDSVRASCM